MLRILTLVILTVGSGLTALSGDSPTAGEESNPTFDGPSMFAPQICGGKTLSSAAKASGWSPDAGTRRCRAAVEDGALVVRASAREQGNFVVSVALDLQKGATARLFLDDVMLDLSNQGETVHLTRGQEQFEFDAGRPKAPSWALLSVSRQKGKLAVTLNHQDAFVFEDKGRSYERIGLEPTLGTMEVNRFMVSGHLVQRDP